MKRDIPVRLTVDIDTPWWAEIRASAEQSFRDHFASPHCDWEVWDAIQADEADGSRLLTASQVAKLHALAGRRSA